MNPVVAHLRGYRSSTRIVGVDVARALAVLGMFAAHVGVTVPFDWARPGSWLDVVNGRSSILFALLAGVSIAIISGGRTPARGDELRRARVRIVARAVLVFVLGAWLVALETRIAVILPVYALLFIGAVPVLRWRSRSLFLLAGALAVVMPVVVAAFAPDAPDDLLVDLLLGGHYPALVWFVFVLVGLGVGRLDVRSTVVRMRLVGGGLLLALAGYGSGVLAAAAVLDAATPVPRWAAALASVEAHSGSPFEIVGSTGFALAVTGLCLLAGERLRWPLFPLAAVGSMALSVYTAHVLVVFALGDTAFTRPDNGLFLRFAGVSLVAASAWALVLGRGPLERLLTSVSTLLADGVRRT